MTLEERHNRSDLIELLKMIYGFLKVALKTFFEFDALSRIRGHLLKLKKKSYSYSYDVTFLLRELSTTGIV